MLGIVTMHLVYTYIIFLIQSSHEGDYALGQETMHVYMYLGEFRHRCLYAAGENETAAKYLRGKMVNLELSFLGWGDMLGMSISKL